MGTGASTNPSQHDRKSWITDRRAVLYTQAGVKRCVIQLYHRMGRGGFCLAVGSETGILTRGSRGCESGTIVWDAIHELFENDLDL